MVALENTHNAAGGTVLTPEDTASLADVAHANGLAVHLDGARIFNSSAYLETPGVRAGQRTADTVSFCLSKGLGAPVGSLLLRDRRRDTGGAALAADARLRDEAGGHHRGVWNRRAGERRAARRGQRQRPQARRGTRRYPRYRDRAGAPADQPALLRGHQRPVGQDGAAPRSAGSEGWRARRNDLAARHPPRHHPGRHRLHPRGPSSQPSPSSPGPRRRVSNTVPRL